MKISVIAPGELDANLMARWHALRRASTLPALRSPFYTPEFARLIGEVQPAARIAVIELDGSLAGFFAFERSGPGTARPLGGRMSDHHGPVLDEGASLDPARLLRGCGLVRWRFDHLPAGAPGFERFETSRARAWLIRLQDGFEAYRREIDGRTSWLRRNEAKMRRLERQFGPLRFAVHTPDPGAFSSLAQWKSSQYRRSGLVDNFRIPWVSDYLERLRHLDTPALAGLMSTLHAGERLVAVHLGLRSESVWHHYLPSYDRDLSSHSPGLCLLHRMAEQAPAQGLDTIDFSSGDMDYKLAVSNVQVEVAQGAVEPVVVRALRLGGHRAVDRLRRTPWLREAARWGRRRAVAWVNRRR